MHPAVKLNALFVVNPDPNAPYGVDIKTKRTLVVILSTKRTLFVKLHNQTHPVRETAQPNAPYDGGGFGGGGVRGDGDDGVRMMLMVGWSTMRVVGWIRCTVAVGWWWWHHGCGDVGMVMDGVMKV
ncbi:hypothetical protein Tco_1277958, partial [Tanacetum coccineum]